MDFFGVKRKKEQSVSGLLPDYLEHWSFLTKLRFVLNFRNNLQKINWNCISDSPVFLLSSFGFPFCLIIISFYSVQGCFWFCVTRSFFTVDLIYVSFRFVSVTMSVSDSHSFSLKCVWGPVPFFVFNDMSFFRKTAVSLQLRYLLFSFEKVFETLWFPSLEDDLEFPIGLKNTDLFSDCLITPG